MKTVIATNMSARLGVNIKELGRIANEGEQFECTDDRLVVLSGSNKFHAVFAVEKPVEKVVVEEPAVEETTTTKKKTTKKKTEE